MPRTNKSKSKKKSAAKTHVPSDDFADDLYAFNGGFDSAAVAEREDADGNDDERDDHADENEDDEESDDEAGDAAALLSTTKSGAIRIKMANSKRQNSSSSLAGNDGAVSSGSALHLTFPHLSYRSHPLVLESLVSKGAKNVANIDLDELKALASELHTLQRESKERAVALENELRQLFSVSNGTGSLENEDFYRRTIGQIYSVDISDEVFPVESTDSSFGGNAKRKRSSKRGGDDDYVMDDGGMDDEDAGSPKRKKARSKKKKGGAGDSGDDGGSDYDSTDERFKLNRTNLSAKEKASAIKEFWEMIDRWFGWPTTDATAAVKPIDVIDNDGAFQWPSIHPSRNVLAERSVYGHPSAAAVEQTPMFTHNGGFDKGKDAGKKSKKDKKKDKKDKRERERERDREEQKREYERAQKKQLESTRLQLHLIDDPRMKKQIIETDRLLDHVNPLLYQHSLSQRILQAIIEIPNANPNAAYALLPAITNGNKLKSPVAGGHKKSKKAEKALSGLSADDRIHLELRALGLFESADRRELYDRRDDEVCVELRVVQSHLRHSIGSLQPSKRHLYPIAVRTSDHEQRMAILHDAEAQLSKTYKKKKVTDAAAQKAAEQFAHTQSRVGSWRQITGFTPSAGEQGGIPDIVAAKMPPPMAYAQYFTETPPLPPLHHDTGRGGYGRQYGRGYQSAMSLQYATSPNVSSYQPNSPPQLSDNSPPHSPVTNANSAGANGGANAYSYHSGAHKNTDNEQDLFSGLSGSIGQLPPNDDYFDVR